ncbi:hypothetical protein SDC9_127651 [bioreactor metagenome]|uniref:Uncharacterized protein n=1 Tax=bioreactor metagenome TaxID=1076179 RepID=A0A645CUM7_9ZZZZ
MIQHLVEPYLCAAAAGHNLNVGSLGFVDRLQQADVQFVIDGVDAVDLRIGRQNVGHGRQSRFGRSILGTILANDFNVGSNFRDFVFEALDALSVHGIAVGRHAADNDFAFAAQFFVDVVSADHAHGIVVAGQIVGRGGGVDHAVKVDQRNAGIHNFLRGNSQLVIVREQNDHFAAKTDQFVDLVRLLVRVLGSNQLVVQA